MFNSPGGGVPLGRSPWNFQWMSTDGYSTKCRRNIAENLNCLSRVHECYRRQTDRRQTDGRQHIANVNVSSRSLKMLQNTHLIAHGVDICKMCPKQITLNAGVKWGVKYVKVCHNQYRILHIHFLQDNCLDWAMSRNILLLAQLTNTDYLSRIYWRQPEKSVTFSFELRTTACVWGILTTRCFDVSWTGRPTRDGKLMFKVDSSAISRAAVRNRANKLHKIAKKFTAAKHLNL